MFKPGDRIALPYLPILKVENNVAVLKKARFAIGAECGIRHKVRIEAPFYIRGGFRVERVARYRVPGGMFTVKYETPWGTYDEETVPSRNIYLDEMPEDLNALAEKLLREKLNDRVRRIVSVEVKKQITPVNVYMRRFRHAVVEIPEGDYFINIYKDYEGDTYFVYEFVSPDETKLVDDISRVDYVLLTFGHYVESRTGCAQIKILSDVAWSDVKSTCCAIASNAVAMAIARYSSKVVVVRNRLPYRGCCEEWEIEEWVAELPPRRMVSYTATEPVATSISPDEVV